MPMESNAHNYMETLVVAILSNDEFTSKYDKEQLADLMCISLNQLKPIYIRHDIDFLSGLKRGKLDTIKQQVKTAVEVAEMMIIKDERNALRE